MIKLLRSLSCLVLLAAACHAEPVTLSNFDAQRLYIALNSIEAGLTAANTTILADDIGILLPKVQAFEKGNTAAQKRHKVNTATRADDPAAERYLAEVQANADQEITVDLTRVNFSEEEITAAKIKPATLAIIRQWLKPAAKK